MKSCLHILSPLHHIITLLAEYNSSIIFVVNMTKRPTHSASAKSCHMLTSLIIPQVDLCSFVLVKPILTWYQTISIWGEASDGCKFVESWSLAESYANGSQQVRKRKSSIELESSSRRRKVQGGSNVEVEHSEGQDPPGCEIMYQENMVKKVREARLLREERRQGSVSDTLKGHCCSCENNCGFSRDAKRCRVCIHSFCILCTDLERKTMKA